MLWTFFSHINGDIKVLKKLLDLPEFKKADRKVCLGNIVKFEGIPETQQEVIRLVRYNSDHALKGVNDGVYLTKGRHSKEPNFDDIIREIYLGNTNFLWAAPTILTLEKRGFIFTNSRLDTHSEHEKRIWDDNEALEEFVVTFKKREYSGAKFIFSGYSIVPSVFDYNFGNVRRLDTNQRLSLNNKGPYLISPGDLSRVDKKSTYAFFEDTELGLEVKSIF